AAANSTSAGRKGAMTQVIAPDTPDDLIASLHRETKVLFSVPNGFQGVRLENVSGVGAVKRYDRQITVSDTTAAPVLPAPGSSRAKSLSKRLPSTKGMRSTPNQPPVALTEKSWRMRPV